MNWKTIFRSFKNKDMRKRLFILLGIIVVYRFLAHVPVPLAEPAQLKEVMSSIIGSQGFGGFMNILMGGGLTSFSIILVGLSPFITASIILQLLTKAHPRLEEIHKDGESGRRKIQQWTRILSVPLAVIQSIAFIFLLQQSVLQSNTTSLGDTSLFQWIVAVTAMTAGSVLLMWFGELITEQGIGNGLSILIFAGIISQVPAMFGTITGSLFDTSSGTLNVFGWFTLPVNPTALWVALAIAILGLASLYILVKINEAQRVIVINYAKRVRGNSSYGGVKSILPIKLITAGVIPVIFAVAIMSLPAFVGQLMLRSGNQNLTEFANILITWFQSPNPGEFTGQTAQAFFYPAMYFVLVVLFTFFYTSVVAFNASEVAENLQKQGGFIEGVRPGQQTEQFLSKTVNRLTLFGALALGFISLMPFIGDYILYHLAGIQNANLSIGGTGLLIVVTVALESLRQLNSRALMVTYDDYK
ncbi:preprotein translocase subunit SecY [Candidatus Saccharibacteria bacterium]|nr:preprotein translocase subunit SecY [Candidatus Saccharibacteria bacterium]